MEKNFSQILNGYQLFRKKYALGDQSIMQSLFDNGQQPQAMVIACCDSRVDPALILQCDPGDLFVHRNVANIVPPYEKDNAHHGTSAALEFAVCFLKVKHIILLGHSQCGGIQTLFDDKNEKQNDFIHNWVSIIKPKNFTAIHPDEYAKIALTHSYQNCLSFPWIKTRLSADTLTIHRWYFDIKTGKIFTYSQDKNHYQEL